MKQPKSFEEGISRLQEILTELGKESTSLSDSVKLYADAASLMKFCTRSLEQQKLKIEEIDLQLAELGKESEQ